MRHCRFRHCRLGARLGGRAARTSLLPWGRSACLGAPRASERAAAGAGARRIRPTVRASPSRSQSHRRTCIAAAQVGKVDSRRSQGHPELEEGLMGTNARIGLLLGATCCLLAVMVDWIVEELA